METSLIKILICKSTYKEIGRILFSQKEKRKVENNNIKIWGGGGVVMDKGLDGKTFGLPVLREDVLPFSVVKKTIRDGIIKKLV